MEFVEGESLAVRLARMRLMSEAEILRRHVLRGDQLVAAEGQL